MYNRSDKHSAFTEADQGLIAGLERQLLAKADGVLYSSRAFLDSEDDHGAIIVHGHTPTRGRAPERHRNRVALDTGAVFGGPLTCGVFEGEKLYFLSAG